MVDATIFRFSFGLTILEGLLMRQIDVVNAYLYGTFDSDIYMKIP